MTRTTEPSKSVDMRTKILKLGDTVVVRWVVKITGIIYEWLIVMM